MVGSGTSDPFLFIFAVLFALTGGDWALIITALVGAGGISGMMTASVGIAKYRKEQRVEREQQVTQVRTVAAEEAENAVKVLGETLTRVNDENIRLRADLEQERRSNVEVRIEMAKQRVELRQLRRDLESCVDAMADHRRHCRDWNGDD